MEVCEVEGKEMLTEEDLSSILWVTRQMERSSPISRRREIRKWWHSERTNWDSEAKHQNYLGMDTVESFPTAESV